MKTAIARLARLVAVNASLLLLAGCHSAFIQARVHNNTPQPIRLFEVDYPSASFGAGNLAAGATFNYRFKVLGSGTTRITWTDTAGHEHTASGPKLSEGEEGYLTVTLELDQARWNAELHAK